MAKVNRTPGEQTAELLKTPIERVITVDSKRIITQDIAKWKRALDSARSETNPRRQLLYELYDNILIDGHLESVVEKFMAHVLNKRVTFVPDKANEGMDLSHIEEYVINTPWFRDIIRYRMQSVLWGHSLVELVMEGGMVARAELVDRRNVVPERGFLAFNYGNLEGSGIYYLEDRAWNKYLLNFGPRKSLGKLLTASQYVIYKRGDFGDWSQFNELFGMPFREFTYNPHNPGDREKIQEAATSSGSASFIILPEGAGVKFHTTNNGTGHTTYDLFKNACNEELSKLFLGNTLTTQQGENGARSLGEVHQDSEDEVLLSHLIETEYELNWQVRDRLIALGHTDLSRGLFRFQESSTIPLDKRIAIDIQLSSRIAIPDSYWYETYGIPRPEGAAATTQEPTPTPEPGGPAAPAGPVAKRKPAQAPAPKVHGLLCCGGMHIGSTIRADYTPTDSDEELLRTLFDGEGRKYDLTTFRANARNLINGLMNGLAPSMEYGEEDTDAAAAMQLNINRFAFTKNLAQMVELNRALKGSETYEDFRGKAATVLGTFNDQYLRTEYNLAKAVGQTSRDWFRIQKDKEIFPYVRYKTVGDANVRASHAALDNKVFSLSDSSWKALNPPNGYGCRCWLEQMTDTAGADPIDGRQAQELMGAEWVKMKASGFAVNRAEQGVVFNIADEYVAQLSGVDTGINDLTYADAQLAPFSDIKATRTDRMPEGEEKNIAPVSRWGKVPVSMGKWESAPKAALSAITAPDEVYMRDGELRFIKMWQDKAVSSRVAVRNGRLELIDVTTGENDAERTGLLIS